MKNLILFLVVLVGCAHVETTPTSDVERISPGDTGLLLPLSLSVPSSDFVPPEGCKLELRDAGAVKDYPIMVKPGLQNMFVRLPEGSYTFFDLYCGRNKTWDFTSKKWAPMFVVEGKVSAGAPMDFKISEKGGMTTYFFNRNDIQKTYRELFRLLKPATQPLVISSYSKKPITSKMTAPTQYQITVKLPSTPAKKGEPEEANYPDFKDCYSNEFVLNPLYVGHISLNASYSKRVFSKIDLVENDSIYTDKFYGCVQNKLKQFIPNRSDELNYDITL